eukprot:NODE_1109_length_2123_cov_38.547000_g938_i0.p1 GENE.NODE_1109_length_2123_cov_38.547000_g938_i0~~NODE_1109_length_2123_cov_38.547000_g938_i0.p1  ORF type:complete len:318 (-),score=55.67 NODE_1109_length_2123_cov_38.547000_g938_i0:90-1043(-)
MRTILQLVTQQLRIITMDNVDVRTNGRPYHISTGLSIGLCHVHVSNDSITCLLETWRNVSRVLEDQKKESNNAMTLKLNLPRKNDDSRSSLPARYHTIEPRGELRISCDDLRVYVLDKLAVVEISYDQLSLTYAENRIGAVVDRAASVVAQQWSLCRRISSITIDNASSVCAACRGPTQVTLFTERTIGKEEVRYRFVAKFGKQLETGANMAELKATTDALREFFSAKGTNTNSTVVLSPNASKKAVTVYIAEEFEFNPEVKWLGPLTAPFQTFLSWLGLSYSAIPEGLDMLCEYLSEILSKICSNLDPTTNLQVKM